MHRAIEDDKPTAVSADLHTLPMALGFICRSVERKWSTTMRTRTENYNIIGRRVMHVAFAIWIMMWTRRKYWWCFHFYRRFSHVFGSCKVRACTANDTLTRSEYRATFFAACAVCCRCVHTTYYQSTSTNKCQEFMWLSCAWMNGKTIYLMMTTAVVGLWVG